MMSKWDTEETEEIGQNPGHQNSANRSLFVKFLNMFGFEAEIVEEEEEESPAAAGTSRRESKERGKLLSLTNSAKTVKILIIEPENFEEVQVIVDHLKNKRAVIINLEETDKPVARRIADFLGGAIYALEGTMQRVSGSIFLFTPAHIEVAMAIKTELKDNERIYSGNNLTTNYYKNRGKEER